MVTTRWELKFQKRPERPTSARLGAFPWVIYWIYLRQQAQGVTAQSNRSKTIYEIQDGELTLGSQRVGVKCISSWAKLVTSLLIEADPVN